MRLLERKHNPENLSNARALRRNMTTEERRLWYDFLRAYPVKFTRQKNTREVHRRLLFRKRKARDRA